MLHRTTTSAMVLQRRRGTQKPGSHDYSPTVIIMGEVFRRDRHYQCVVRHVNEENYRGIVASSVCSHIVPLSPSSPSLLLHGS